MPYLIFRDVDYEHDSYFLSMVFLAFIGAETEEAASKLTCLFLFFFLSCLPLKKFRIHNVNTFQYCYFKNKTTENNTRLLLSKKLRYCI